jgi:hypothetical protein
MINLPEERPELSIVNPGHNNYLYFQMDISKINPWLGGVLMLIAGSVSLYYESYKNSELINGVSYLLILLGAVLIFGQLIKGSLVDAERVPYGDNKSLWFQQAISKLLAYGILAAVVFGDGYYLMKLSGARRDNILANGHSKITIADVNAIVVSHSKSNTYYCDIFRYVVDGKVVIHRWYEHQGDFTAGEQYQIKYSVEYPEMFKLVKRVR